MTTGSLSTLHVLSPLTQIFWQIKMQAARLRNLPESHLQHECQQMHHTACQCECPRTALGHLRQQQDKCLMCCSSRFYRFQLKICTRHQVAAEVAKEADAAGLETNSNSTYSCACFPLLQSQHRIVPSSELEKSASELLWSPNRTEVTVSVWPVRSPM